MAAESFFAVLVKIVWAPLVAIVAWLAKRSVDTYTKHETEKYLDSRIRPLEIVVANLDSTLKQQIKAIEKLTEVMADLDKRLALEEERSKWQK